MHSTREELDRRVSLRGSDGVFDQSPREGLDALSYAFGRIGRCINSGGRRIQRLEESQRYVLKRPDVEGRFSPRGSFKQVIAGLRGRGTPNDSQEEGSPQYITGRRARPEDRVPFYPHTRSLRRDRREASRAAIRAERHAAAASRHPRKELLSQPVPDSGVHSLAEPTGGDGSSSGGEEGSSSGTMVQHQDRSVQCVG